MQDDTKRTDSGIDIKKVYTTQDLPTDINEQSLPGEFPLPVVFNLICIEVNYGLCVNMLAFPQQRKAIKDIIFYWLKV